jgi:hypothetical protein
MTPNATVELELNSEIDVGIVVSISWSLAVFVQVVRPNSCSTKNGSVKVWTTLLAILFFIAVVSALDVEFVIPSPSESSHCMPLLNLDFWRSRFKSCIVDRYSDEFAEALLKMLYRPRPEEPSASGAIGKAVLTTEHVCELEMLVVPLSASLIV